jgi:hypothetical protein
MAKTKVITDSLKTIAPATKVFQAIRADAKRNKTSKLTRQQIDREIAAHRRERKLGNAAPKRRP